MSVYCYLSLASLAPGATPPRAGGSLPLCSGQGGSTPEREGERAVHPSLLSCKCLLENAFGSQIRKGCGCRKVMYLSRWWLSQQPSRISWEVNKIPFLLHMQPWLQAKILRKMSSWCLGGLPGGCTSEQGGHQRLGAEELCTRQSSGWPNLLYKGSDIFLALQHNAAIAKATTADQAGSIALIPRLSGAL